MSAGERENERAYEISLRGKDGMQMEKEAMLILVSRYCMHAALSFLLSLFSRAGIFFGQGDRTWKRIIR